MSYEDYLTSAEAFRRQERFSATCREQGMVSARAVLAIMAIYLAVGLFLGFAIGYIIGKG